MVVKNPFPVKEAPMSAVPTEPVETIEPQPAVVRVNIPFVSRLTSFIPGHTLRKGRVNYEKSENENNLCCSVFNHYCSCNHQLASVHFKDILILFAHISRKMIKAAINILNIDHLTFIPLIFQRNK